MAKQRPLTIREREALAKIKAYIAKQGQAPTYFEIGLMLDSSHVFAKEIVGKLVGKKYLAIAPNVVRGISVIEGV